MLKFVVFRFARDAQTLFDPHGNTLYVTLLSGHSDRSIASGLITPTVQPVQ